MLQLGSSVTVPDMKGVDMKTLMKGLQFHAPEIADTILARVEDRTPVDTGALKEDEAYTLGGSDPGALVTWYVGDEYQLAENHREYSMYQEGPFLGLPTDTNAPHQMFAQIATTDQALIQAWAEASVQEGIDAMTNAANAGSTTSTGGTP